MAKAAPKTEPDRQAGRLAALKAERELALPSLDALLVKQRILDEAAPLLIDHEARRAGVIVGGIPSDLQGAARQLRTWQQTLLGELPDTLAEDDVSPELIDHFLAATAAAVPEPMRHRFAVNYATSERAKRARKAVTGHRHGARIANEKKAEAFEERDGRLSILFETLARLAQSETGCSERAAEKKARDDLFRNLRPVLNIGPAQFMRIINRERRKHPGRSWRGNVISR